jgi:hypothetical protein
MAKKILLVLLVICVLFLALRLVLLLLGTALGFVVGLLGIVWNLAPFIAIALVIVCVVVLLRDKRH